MKKIVVLFLLTAILVIPLKGRAEDKDDIDARIGELEKEVELLKSKQEEVAKTPVKSKFPVKLYGFIATQLFWGDSKTEMYGGINSACAPSRVADETTTAAKNDAYFSATPQNSRVGLKWTGTKLTENVSIGGMVELDFVNILRNTSYGSSPIPRIRHLSLELNGNRWSLLAGQNWDLFSPLNTRSLSLGNNIWFQGNMGFRRVQLQFNYKIPFNDVNTLRFATSVNHPSNSDDLYTGGVESGIPYGEGLIQYNRKMKHGDLIIAASGVAGVNRANNSNSNMWGVTGSLAVPIHKFFKLSGEFHYGQDLGALLTYAGTGSEIRNMAAWGQISSRWHKKFETNIGYGIDDMGQSKVTAGGIERNQAAYGNFKFYPAEPFYFGIEYEHLRTNYKGNGTSTANVVFANLVYTF